MKVAVYQMDIIAGRPAENQEKVKQWLANEMEGADKPDVCLLPEMWTTAYTLDDLPELAEDETQMTTQFLSNLAKTHKVNIVGGSFAVKGEEGIYNRALVFNREGELIYQYDKIHLVPMLDEHLYLAPGKSQAETFELDGKKAGLVICYDLRFPKLIRAQALEGAEVLFIIAEWPEARQAHWYHLQIARAIENQMYVVSSNRVGTHAGVEFGGKSMIINPWGDILAEGSNRLEETVKATINLDEVQEVRKNVPVFESRVPNMYKYL